MARLAGPRTPSTYIGHVIGASFGLVFVVVNSSPLGPQLRGAACVLAGAAFAVVLTAFARTVADERRSETRDPVRLDRHYWLIVTVEAVALFGGLAVLARIEPAAALGWIALVVGLHFIPMSRLWPPGRRQILLIGIAMTALGVVGLTLAVTTHDREAVALVSGVGSGVLLLGSTLVSALRTWGRLKVA
jgi:hypothetical protein